MKASDARLPGAECTGLLPCRLEDTELWAPPLFPPRPSERPAPRMTGPESGGFCPSADSKERRAVSDCVWHPLASLLTISLLQGPLLLEKFSFIDFYF